MKYIILLVFTIIFLHKISAAQSDTAIVYLNELGNYTKEDATSYTKFYKQDNLWHGITFNIKTNLVKSEGNYKEMNFNHPVGTFKNYSDKGNLLFIATYNDSSQPLERTFFSENGSKRSWIKYNGSKGYEQICWDSTGKEMPFCKIETEARFKGGEQGWRKFLEQNLNANVAVRAGAPAGLYKVEVQFVVDKQGKVSNIKPTTIPENCKPCAKEVVRILTKSPDWEPATLNGIPFNYLALQSISFAVEETTKRKKD